MGVLLRLTAIDHPKRLFDGIRICELLCKSVQLFILSDNYEPFINLDVQSITGQQTSETTIDDNEQCSSGN